jgi:hypothetical protein
MGPCWCLLWQKATKRWFLLPLDIKSFIQCHLEFARHVIRYLKDTKGLWLVLGGNNSSLSGYSYADWVSNLDHHSISGFAFFLGNRVVSWSSKKQPIVTLLSMESKYVCLTHAAKDIIWIQKLLQEISPIGLKYMSPPSNIFFDNQGAIQLSKDSTSHTRTRPGSGSGCVTPFSLVLKDRG